MSDPRLGVFICECDGEIGRHLDTVCLERQAHRLPGVAVSQRLPRACSHAGLEAIRAAITAQGLERVLVAGCTPRTLGSRFRAFCEDAGLDAASFELVDIREGCAWVHQGTRGAATAKACDLIRMGVARVTHRQAHQPISAEVVPTALVIGGGLAGMTAALTLANADLPVKLVERETSLGGMLRHVHTLHPSRHSAAEPLAEKIGAVKRHPKIQLLLGSQVAGITGSVGRYLVSVDRADNRRDGRMTHEVGAIIVATGAHTPRPDGLYGYDGQRVLTQIEFERELRGMASASQPLELPSTIVMILCAGQRDGEVPYCSGVCCVAALQQAIEAKAADPQVQVTVVYRDLNLLGEATHEEALRTACKAGVDFVRYSPSRPPHVKDETVEVHDERTDQLRQIPYHRVVLATPMVPQPDAARLSHMLRIARDSCGFFPQVRDRLRPGEICHRGIFTCGAAHHPCSRKEADLQATSAAFNAIRHLRSGAVENGAPGAVVDGARCTGCGTCIFACPFDAIALRERQGVLDLAQIDPMLCKGCGNCVVTCPVKAINVPEDSDAQLMAEIEAALVTGPQDDGLRILAFGCEWSHQIASDLAGAHRLGYPVEVRTIRLRCSARFDPLHALWGLHNGADGVFVGACHPGDCHYIRGNRYAQERLANLRWLFRENGFDPRRLRLAWITPDDPHDFVGKITDFTSLVRALGPSPTRGRQTAMEEPVWQAN